MTVPCYCLVTLSCVSPYMYLAFVMIRVISFREINSFSAISKVCPLTRPGSWGPTKHSTKDDRAWITLWRTAIPMGLPSVIGWYGQYMAEIDQKKSCAHLTNAPKLSVDVPSSEEDRMRSEHVDMTSHGGVGIAKEARIAHALLLADFRVPVAGVERTCVRNEVGGGGGALIDGLVETIRQVSDRQFGGGQLGKLRQRRTILAATATTHPTPNKQQSSEPF